MTQKRDWDSTKASGLPSSLNSSNAVIENHTYDGYGNQTSSTDARGTVTTSHYDANNLYLTSQVVNSNSNLGTRSRTTTYSFDFNTGLKTAETDADNNNVSTTYSYDWLGRETLRTEASARRTQTSYEDQNLRVVVKKDQNTLGDGALVEVTDYDALGRVRLERQLENAGTHGVDDDTAGIKVQRRYQYGTGARYELASNPYRASTSGNASGESGMGWTVTKYDKGGRLVSKQHFDASGLPAPWGSNGNTSGTASTSYTGFYTTVTDEAGNARVTQVDGLGRLSAVWEDPGSSPHYNYQTT